MQPEKQSMLSHCTGESLTQGISPTPKPWNLDNQSSYKTDDSLDLSDSPFNSWFMWGISEINVYSLYIVNVALQMQPRYLQGEMHDDMLSFIALTEAPVYPAS